VLSGYSWHILMVHLTLCLRWVGIYLYFICNLVLIKFDQLKMLNALSQSTIKPLHSFFPPHLLSTTSAHPCYKQCCSKRESCYEDVAGARRTQPPVDCLWRSLRFQDLSVNSDNLPFSYVILFLYTLICHYMHDTWSRHAYRFVLGFLWKNRCDRVVSELYRL
jgi:hypothetical protein